MKSTGEVLGVGKDMAEALFKGLTSAGFTVPSFRGARKPGVLISVEESDYQEVLSLAKRFYDLGIDIYATKGTADTINSLGIKTVTVEGPAKSSEIFGLMEKGALNYIVYTGAVKDQTMGDFITLHRRAMQLGVPCLTSLDTASALTEIIESRYNTGNTELVDINDMRQWKSGVHFAKMQSCGNDYIFIEDFDGSITCPESLCVRLCAPHYGIGADGIVLIERSQTADVKMRTFNRDGSEGRMAGNNIRCVGKYLFDKGYIRSEFMTVETGGKVYPLKLYTRDGKVSSVSVNMGFADFDPASLPAETEERRLVDYPLKAGDKEYKVTCLSVGNPHCVVFTDSIDGLDIGAEGPLFEYHPMFPERTNTEFVRPVNRNTLRMRVWERGNGETMACGTGVCAAAAAAVRKGLCDKNTDITVKVLGGDLTVNVSDKGIILTGETVMVYEGEFEY